MDETKLFAVIGDPVAHSLSPAMHNAAFRAAGKNAEYVAIRVAPEDVESFFAEARTNLAGFNVTVPHKGAACRLSDELSDGARLAGSVNTVRVDENGSVLYGDTTDGYGFETAVREAFDLSLAGSDLCLIGCGGVAHAIAWHAALAGVKSLRVLNRSVEKAKMLTDAVREHFPQIVCEYAALNDTARTEEFLAQTRLAVQCTSLGLHAGEPLPVDPALFPSKGICCFDTIYRHTPMQIALENRGIPTQDGLSMLLYQGARAYEIWFGEPAPADIMREALLKAVQPR